MKETISLAVIGFIIAIGRMLVSSDKLTVRTLIGRGILGAAVGLVSYPLMFLISTMLPVPTNTEYQILIGLCCALSAAGTEIIEKALGAIIYKFTGKEV